MGFTAGMTEQEMQLIAVDPEVLHGQAHIRGTRIPVSLVLGCLAEGLTEKEILEESSDPWSSRSARGAKVLISEVGVSEVGGLIGRLSQA